MKFRSGFVTNSSSASYLVVFSRINDAEKADKIISKYPEIINKLSLEELIKNMKSYLYLSSDTLGVDCRPSEKYLNELEKTNPDSTFAIIDNYVGSLHAGEFGIDYDDPEYDDWVPGEDVHPTDVLEAVSLITEKNGFTDIDCQRGYGFDG